MDLLGRKSRALLEQVVVRASQLEEQRNEAVRIANSQGSTITDLLGRLNSREALISDLILETAELKGRIFQLENPPKPAPSERPIHMDDAEAELAWQLSNNLISKGDYEKLLEDLDFQNAEIELDPDYRPRPDLTY